MGPEIVIPFGFFATAIILAIGIPIARAFSRRIDAESRSPRIPTEVVERLERMERTLDVVALEIERITEGQRFTTKLLAESTGGDPRQAGTPKNAQDRVT